MLFRRKKFGRIKKKHNLSDRIDHLTLSMKIFRTTRSRLIGVITILIPVIILLFAACSKKSGSPNPSGNSTLPDSTFISGNTKYVKANVTIDYDTVSGKSTDSTLSHISYDAQHRDLSTLSHYYSFLSGGQDYSDSLLISYTTGKIVLDEHTAYPDGHIDETSTTHWLNSVTNLADSSTASRTTSTIPEVSMDKITYKYDANGYLISENQYAVSNGMDKLSSIMNFTISNGNTVSMNGIIYFTPGDTTLSLVIFDNSTFTNQADPTLSITGNGNNFLGSELLTGHSNIDLMASLTVQDNPVKLYIYSLDNQGRISSSMTTSATGKLLQMVRNYYY
jgi:hypothetical protein